MHLWLNMHTVWSYESLPRNQRLCGHVPWHMVNYFTFEKEEKTNDKGNKNIIGFFFILCPRH